MDKEQWKPDSPAEKKLRQFLQHLPTRVRPDPRTVGVIGRQILDGQMMNSLQRETVAAISSLLVTRIASLEKEQKLPTSFLAILASHSLELEQSSAEQFLQSLRWYGDRIRALIPQIRQKREEKEKKNTIAPTVIEDEQDHDDNVDASGFQEVIPYSSDVVRHLRELMFDFNANPDAEETEMLLAADRAVKQYPHNPYVLFVAGCCFNRAARSMGIPMSDDDRRAYLSRARDMLFRSMRALLEPPYNHLRQITHPEYFGLDPHTPLNFDPHGTVSRFRIGVMKRLISLDALLTKLKIEKRGDFLEESRELGKKRGRGGDTSEETR